VRNIDHSKLIQNHKIKTLKEPASEEKRTRRSNPTKLIQNTKTKPKGTCEVRKRKGSANPDLSTDSKNTRSKPKEHAQVRKRKGAQI
jgi:hypothetical protein